MYLTSEERDIITSTLEDLNVDEIFEKYVLALEKDIYNTIETNATKHNLEKEFKDLVYNSILKDTLNDDNTFKYLFHKLKEYTLCTVLNDLVAKHDVRFGNYVDISDIVRKALYYNDTEDTKIEKTAEDNYKEQYVSQSSLDTITKKTKELLSNISITITGPDNYIRNIPSINTNDFDRIYDNLKSSLDRSFFFLNTPFLYNSYYNENDLPKSNALSMVLLSQSFYSSNMGLQNLYKSSKTILNNLKNEKKIRTAENLITQYNDGIYLFSNILKYIPNKPENALERNLIIFNMNRIYKNSFTHSLDHPFIIRLLNNINMENLSSFLFEWYEKSDQKDNLYNHVLPVNFNNHNPIPFEIIDSAYNLTILELIYRYNLDFSLTDVSNILALNLVDSSFTRSDGTTQMYTEFEKTFMEHNKKINDFYRFLYDLLLEHNKYLLININSSFSDIFKVFSALRYTYKEGITFSDVFREISNYTFERVINICLTKIKKDKFDPSDKVTEKDILVINTIIDSLFKSFVNRLTEEIDFIPTFKQNSALHINDLDNIYIQIENNIAIFAYLMIISANNY